MDRAELKNEVETIKAIVNKYRERVRDFDDLVGYCLYRYWKIRKKTSKSLNLRLSIRCFYIDYMRTNGRYSRSGNEKIGYLTYIENYNGKINKLSYNPFKYESLYNALNSLKGKEKEFVKAHYFLGYKQCEIAKEENKSVAYVSMKIKEGLKNMRREYV